jgi:hypothetical protein
MGLGGTDGVLGVLEVPVGGWFCYWIVLFIFWVCVFSLNIGFYRGRPGRTESGGAGTGRP